MKVIGRLAGVITSLLVGYLLILLNFWITYYTTIVPASFSLFFVIPVGAVFFGALAAAGHPFLLYIQNKKLQTIDLYTCVALSIIFYFGVYAYEYYFYVIKDGLSDQITFWNFMKLLMNSQKHYLGVGKIPLMVNVGSLTFYSYAKLLIGFFGAMLGGAISFSLVYSFKMCHLCGCYLKHSKEKKLFFDNEASLEEYVENVKNTPTIQRKDFFFSAEETAVQENKVARFVWTLEDCKKCRVESLVGKAQVYGKTIFGDDWKETYET